MRSARLIDAYNAKLHEDSLNAELPQVAPVETIKGKNVVLQMATATRWLNRLSPHQRACAIAREAESGIHWVELWNPNCPIEIVE